MRQTPPLRERSGDLALLVEHFAGDEWRVDPEVVPTLERYSWPGNVRQFQNAIDRAKILAVTSQLSASAQKRGSFRTSACSAAQVDEKLRLCRGALRRDLRK
jgi:DNA-binding NtrC family response regulator